jgi:hypothetical protein
MGRADVHMQLWRTSPDYLKYLGTYGLRDPDNGNSNIRVPCVSLTPELCEVAVFVYFVQCATMLQSGTQGFEEVLAFWPCSPPDSPATRPTGSCVRHETRIQHVGVLGRIDNGSMA